MRMKLNTLERSKGFKAKSRRIWRWAYGGNYSGHGCKGQNARSGSSMKPRFEGGQTSIAMRMPKTRGFKRYYKLVDNYTVINVCTLDADERITNEVTKEILKTNGYIKKESDLVKILWNWELNKSLSFAGIEKFTKSAIEKIEKAWGKIS